MEEGHRRVLRAKTHCWPLTARSAMEFTWARSPPKAGGSCLPRLAAGRARRIASRLRRGIGAGMAAIQLRLKLKTVNHGDTLRLRSGQASEHEAKPEPNF